MKNKSHYVPKGQDRSSGFTLIELMIVVAVIAVIAAIALPSYNSSVIKSKRQIGKGELMKVLSRQERHFVNNKAYATDLTNLGYGENPYYINDQGEQVPAASKSESIYQIALDSPSATGFTVQAIPQNQQTDDADCATLELSNTGLKTATGSNSSSCW